MTMLGPLFVLLQLSATSAPEQMPDTLRVASVQMEITDSLDQNLARILQHIEEAKAQHARVVVFPETALSGFSKTAIASLDFSAVEAAMARVAQAAQAAQAAQSAGIYVIYGCATRSNTDKPYNSAIVIAPDGQEIARYHKMFPEDRFEPGDHLSLFSIDGIPCTLMICHDERFPELCRVPVLAGARICFYISCEINRREAAERKAEGYRTQVIARAVENNIWVVQSNGVGPLDGQDGVSLGQSHIVAPDGTLLQEGPKLQEAVLVQEIQPEKATRANALETARNPVLNQWYHSAQALLQPQPPSAVIVREKTHARLALMQGVPEKWNLEKNFKAFLERLAEADAQDADIFITPECWLDGYASPDKTSTRERLIGIAQDLEKSPFLKRVGEEARNRKMYICFGFTSLENGAPYNAAGLWNDLGELEGVYHKTHLQTHDLQYNPGLSLPVWPSPWGPLGIMICADRRWPETARTLRLQGARLILNPTYGMSHLKNEWWMRTRSYENQCYVAFAHPKVGFVTDPKGDIAAKRDSDTPGVLVCDVDLDKAQENNHLQDRRPELYLPITEPAAQTPSRPARP